MLLYKTAASANKNPIISNSLVINKVPTIIGISHNNGVNNDSTDNPHVKKFSNLRNPTQKFSIDENF